MLTCKSPRKVMRTAYALAAASLPDHTSKFSRRDFTLPQLLACLTVKEMLKRSYRGAEAVLRDCRHSCKRHAKQTVGHGSLYQGRYRSFPVQDDGHFLTLCRYVERNAFSAHLTDRAEHEGPRTNKLSNFRSLQAKSDSVAAIQTALAIRVRISHGTRF